MVPMAGLMAFSRVYLGVHYPSDAIAGLILGAGYAAFGLWTLNAFWRWAGPKWFPEWWRLVPSIIVREDVHLKFPPRDTTGGSNAIRSLSRGRASYSMTPSHFERVPEALAAKVISAAA